MNTANQSATMFAPEQFRMSRLQVYNWGTFTGIHDIPVAEKGYLFVGRSGAGKSSLLDAITALLVPPKWVDFNAAAREGERSRTDRNSVSYIRGAWAEKTDDESGIVSTRYLRPGTTWSALSLTFRNPLNQFVTLVQLFWLRGSANGTTDVKRHYLIFERAFDLRELEDFPQSNFDVRKLKQTFPDAFEKGEFSPYRERFCRLLGIESEQALRLLNKTQSAKNLGDLNTFLRDFMLDKPETFQVAERLVDEFVELNAAHEAVVTAREQIQVLKPAADAFEEYKQFKRQRKVLDDLQQGVDSYREARRIRLLEQYLKDLSTQSQGAKGIAEQHEAEWGAQKDHLKKLEDQHRNLGGAQIEQWETEVKRLEGQRDERLTKHDKVKIACQNLEWPVPDNPQAFAVLVNQARHEIEDWENQAESSRQELLALGGKSKDAEKELTEARKEVEALQKHPSNIPARMLELRQEIAAALGLPETALPFVGELIEVKPEESKWQGAIERLLHGFALSLLVDERHYAALSTHINAVHLGSRLVYYRTVELAVMASRPLAENSVVLKLNIKDSAYSDWLKNELKQRFDYACVDSLQAFRNVDRALTPQGQIKHSKTRHEKDDSKNIDERRGWVLGFDNRDKLALFERLAQEAAHKLAGLISKIREISEQENMRARQQGYYQTLANLQWQEIDAAIVIKQIADTKAQIQMAREGNSDLKELGLRIAQQETVVTEAEVAYTNAKVTYQSILKQISENELKLEALRTQPLTVLSPLLVQELDERFASQESNVRIENLDLASSKVIKKISKEIEQVVAQIQTCETCIIKRFEEFQRRWPTEASDVDTHLDSAPDFFAKLVRLENDGLPAYEDRFYEMLRNQSNQNLAALSTQLSQARKAILDRMDLVNESLGQSEFNPGTYLRIEATDRQLAEVVEFKREIQQALSHAWGNDPELAEKRFFILRHIVERLQSQEPDHRRWKEAVLDVRLHVEFIGKELDGEGREVEIYRSGSGKSGGQRQKLATTCLAAALRYQLGGNDRHPPVYAPVVLDEAFDKADSEFTTLAMNIFTNFGFQMIVATPLKSVMTLEPFIGGACFVEISNRNTSGIKLIEYMEDQQRLSLTEKLTEEAMVEAS